MVKEGLNDQVAREPRPEGKEEWLMLHTYWGRGTGKYKGPEAGLCLLYARTSKEE